MELPKPEPSDHDLLVRIEAVSVNPVDTKVRVPKDKIEKEPRVLGWDAAGVVEAVGKSVTRFKVGDQVYYAGDITRQGSDGHCPNRECQQLTKTEKTEGFFTERMAGLV